MSSPEKYNSFSNKLKQNLQDMRNGANKEKQEKIDQLVLKKSSVGMTFKLKATGGIGSRAPNTFDP